MFLRNIKRIFSKAKSITAQLTFFYTLASFVLVGGIAAFLYMAMIGVLYQGDRQFLLDEVQVVQYLLEKNDQSTLQHEVRNVPLVLSKSIYHYSIRVIDPREHIIIETPGMKEALRDADFFNIKQSNIQGKWWRASNGDNYLLMQSIITLNQQTWLIQAALDVSYQHAMISKYRQRALTVLIVGVLFSILLGYMIARRGLRRLDELTETTKNITTFSLNQRINAASWPRELRRLGRAFNEMLDRIERAFSQLTQFSDDLAHELRTPITNLMGGTEIVLSHDHSLQEYRHILESNLEELQRIYHIIENILFLARTENPQLNLKKEVLQVQDEIAVICEFYQAIAEDKNIKIIYEGAASISASQVMFRRMISNLLSNALKYTEVNGMVRFVIREVDSRTVEVTLQDTGIGIAPEHLSKIFNRFYRVDAARSQHPGSVGLGLAIVKSIVSLHGGSLFITSDVGEGTVIQMRFPK